jgi:hypothetical protein
MGRLCTTLGSQHAQSNHHEHRGLYLCCIDGLCMNLSIGTMHAAVLAMASISIPGQDNLLVARIGVFSCFQTQTHDGYSLVIIFLDEDNLP